MENIEAARKNNGQDISSLSVCKEISIGYIPAQRDIAKTRYIPWESQCLSEAEEVPRAKPEAPPWLQESTDLSQWIYRVLCTSLRTGIQLTYTLLMVILSRESEADELSTIQFDPAVWYISQNSFGSGVEDAIWNA